MNGSVGCAQACVRPPSSLMHNTLAQSNSPNSRAPLSASKSWQIPLRPPRNQRGALSLLVLTLAYLQLLIFPPQLLADAQPQPQAVHTRFATIHAPDAQSLSDFSWRVCGERPDAPDTPRRLQ